MTKAMNAPAASGACSFMCSWRPSSRVRPSSRGDRRAQDRAGFSLCPRSRWAVLLVSDARPDVRRPRRGAMADRWGRRAGLTCALAASGSHRSRPSSRTRATRSSCCASSPPSASGAPCRTSSPLPRRPSDRAQRPRGGADVRRNAARRGGREPRRPARLSRRAIGGPSSWSAACCRWCSCPSSISACRR